MNKKTRINPEREDPILDDAIESVTDPLLKTLLNEGNLNPLQWVLLQHKVNEIEEKRISKEKELLKELENTLDELEQNLELPWLNSALQQIDAPDLCRVDTTGYQKRFRELEKKVYVKEIVSWFIRLKEWGGSKFREEHLQEFATKAFECGATNDEINAMLIVCIENGLGYTKSTSKNISKGLDTEEFEIRHSEKLALWENLLQELKENPIDFTQFIDKEIPDEDL